MKITFRNDVVIASILLVFAIMAAPPAYSEESGSASWRLLKQDTLINADYWEESPRILGAGLGFTRILGVPGVDISEEGERRVRAAGGSWEQLSDAGNAALRAYTSAATPATIAFAYGFPVKFGGGFPVEFSWPVLPSTVDASDFLITLNNGEQVAPSAASVFPNFEYNERSTIVLVGDFGNRVQPGKDKAVYPVRLQIVADATPLTLVGPDGKRKNAVGMSYGDGVSPMTAYYSGPTLVAAKLSRLSGEGEGGPALFNGNLPNDGLALYGAGAKYRLRMLTTGGFSPDGVRSLYPTEFSRYFRIRTEDEHGKVVWLTETGTDYQLAGGVIRILGLAELGKAQADYTDAYIEDHDNQIDIILEGDEAALRSITHLHIPAQAPYSPLYHPGGPGNDPTPGVRYSKPGPPKMQRVRIALDDPMTVTLP